MDGYRVRGRSAKVCKSQKASQPPSVYRSIDKIKNNHRINLHYNILKKGKQCTTCLKGNHSNFSIYPSNNVNLILFNHSLLNLPLDKKMSEIGTSIVAAMLKAPAAGETTGSFLTFQFLAARNETTGVSHRGFAKLPGTPNNLL